MCLLLSSRQRVHRLNFIGRYLFIAVGKAKVHKQLMEKNKDRRFPVLIHPSAVIVEETEIGIGTVVMAGAVINPNSKIGRGCIINICSYVDYDCILEKLCHLAVKAYLCALILEYRLASYRCRRRVRKDN